ncbi:putative zinc-binding metallopeptidase [Kaistia dalseonensis]|uniref:Zinc-ribbon domain-containing protein n=1 Tax=Kaistia dalseonensis TaxID=410840 RepID=A0ABU0HBL3_9HYPH|nr:putative zinc-binding metallopeptidase [Kaistia dalseonensis]MCX5497060.1 putative zinc-binding metallopeptidase [Kaistia dalseonensis]MDQ0439686.1 hypothetical protein [Kaistia dalseonensis]
MRLFECQACSYTLSFEETLCGDCGRELGYEPAMGRLLTIESAGDGVFSVFGTQSGAQPSYRRCANASHGACNWLIAADSNEMLCLCCRTNTTIPDISNEVFAGRWREIELAKHRLFYSLIRLGLATPNKQDDPAGGLSFQFLADLADLRVMTGHEDGLITINIAEADSVERERARNDMHEPYRTLLGHFRHEIGHYYWDRLVRDASRFDDFRAVFGDEQDDYQAALQRYYAGNFPQDWRDRFVTQYASSHPWEDFAETFAHYLHMIDTLETAYAFGLRIRPRARLQSTADTTIDFDPYRAMDFTQIVESWGPLTYAVNSLNRSMGQPDLYPFTLVPGVIEKLGFIDRLMKEPMAALRAA